MEKIKNKIDKLLINLIAEAKKNTLQLTTEDALIGVKMEIDILFNKALSEPTTKQPMSEKANELTSVVRNCTTCKFLKNNNFATNS